MSTERRRFLKNSAQVTGWAVGSSVLSPFLSGCSALDQLFLGDGHDQSDKVVILGGGLAGLSAALYLKKAQIPFRVYEGDSRLGGRVQSISEINSSLQSADLGGEFISGSHGTLINLAKELRVSLTEMKRGPFSAF